jgi:hypothetical protein
MNIMLLSVNKIISTTHHLLQLIFQVKYPDQQMHLVAPSVSDFKQLSSLVYKLVTKVFLSHVLWSGWYFLLLAISLELLVIQQCGDRR